MITRPKIQLPAPAPPPPSPSFPAPTTTRMDAEASAVAMAVLVNARLDHRSALPEAMSSHPSLTRMPQRADLSSSRLARDGR
jgi:hypothetical protein